VRLKSSNRIHDDIPLLILASLVLLAQPSGKAVADDLAGLYVGGAVGQSRVEATDSQVFTDIGSATYTEDINQRHFAFKVMLGARPISLLGAEIDCIDFGKPNASLFGNPADASIKGAAAFGVLYLPVPIVDIYVKAGVARLESTINGSICSPCACDFQICRSFFELNRTNTSGAGGVGAQYKFGAWAVRAEYERFSAAGGNPSLLSAGITWTFL
jgi:Outer membrane protein beta-barrel domain